MIVNRIKIPRGKAAEVSVVICGENKIEAELRGINIKRLKDFFKITFLFNFVSLAIIKNKIK